MTDPGTPGPELTPSLRLRGGGPTVTRISRRVLLGGTLIAGIAVSGALIYALHGWRGSVLPSELYNIGHRTTPDGLTALPSDYTQVPKLGPPLPGDLGRPILHAQNQSPPAAGPDPAQQRRAQEQEAARISKLFAGTATRPTEIPLVASSSLGSTSSPAPGLPGSVDPTAVQNMQDRKLAFLNGPADRRTVSPDRLEKPASPYVIQAGSVISAALLTGIRSDLPGQITAQVTENAYDSPTGRYLLIPQGTRLVGQYDSQIAFAQSRVQFVWTRLLLPNGQSIVLERQPGSDPQGYSGAEDDVDHHWGLLFKAALLSTILSVGAQVGVGDNENNLAEAIRLGASNSISQTGQQIVGRNLNVQPTLTIRPGFPVRVIVNRDLVLAPYQ
ncbi:MAG: TrbI/VirB10 family protein [Proteobacteria bacterium]|nr:TrbI/VirB10 family protein [Pseudomonadota bacterium]